MRRKDGTGLVRNERKVLAAALRLALDGDRALYGYELFARLREWEGEAPMDHGTLYRCLRALETRGFFTSEVDRSTERIRVVYRLTTEGAETARKATIQLAAEDTPLSWIDVALVSRPLPPLGCT
jgi:DNA-binding PadR family transcriptional regulator